MPDKCNNMNSEDSDFNTLDNNFVVGWVVKTIFALMIGAGVGFAIAQLLFCGHNVTKELLGSVLLGTVVGAFVGIAQASQLRNIIRDPKLWVIASIVGWAIAAFLFEVNWPISRCISSSNAASYTPGNFIRAIHNPIFIISERIERMITGETIHRGIYISATVVLMGFLIGAMLGIPQGIGQWLVLRKDTPRSLNLIWVNVLIWATTYFLILIVVDLVNFNMFWSLTLLPVVLIVPATIIALMLVRLRKGQVGDKPTFFTRPLA